MKMKKLISWMLLSAILATALLGCSKEGEKKVTYYERPAGYTEESVGLDAYLSLDRLAFINPDNYTYGVSSAGRSNVNSDGFDGQNWLYIDDNGDHVICEAKGKGIINRIWTTGTYNEQAIVKIYVDDTEEPVYADYYYNFTKGTAKPFVYPIAKFWNQSAGGRINYLPIQFSEYVKVAIQNPGVTNLFWHVDYQLLEPSQEVTPFTGMEDNSALIQQWKNAGLDFKSGTGAVKSVESASLAAGQSHTFFETQGMKQIQSIKITIPGLELPENAGKADANRTSQNLREELTGLRLKIWWDGEAEPSVDCSLASFFGMGSFGYNNAVQALFYGVKDGAMYNYFPMPFQKSAKLVVENTSGKQIDVSVDVRCKPVDYDFYNVGYFTTCEKNFYVNSADPIEVCLLSETGSGKIVNIQLNCFGDPERDVNYEEGDVRVYVDGVRTPQMVSPGMEDFFNGAGYFLDGSSRAKRGLYTTELSGYTNWFVSEQKEQGISVYRTFANDAITFRNGVKFCIEHGGCDRNPEAVSWHQNQPVGYVSLICYYHTPIQRMEQTDCIDMADDKSMEDHGFRVSGTTSKIAVSSGFIGGFDLVTQNDVGIAHTDAAVFTVQLNEKNHGAVLYRLFDYTAANVGASVYIDGAYAGEWYKAGYNDIFSLCEDVFVVPASMTEGKKQIQVELKPNEGCTWTALEYTVHSIVDKDTDAKAFTSGDFVTVLAGERALRTDEGVLSFAAPDETGKSDFRLVEYYDGSFFLINCADGSVLCSDGGTLKAASVTTQKLGENFRWVLEQTDKGVAIRNLADSVYIGTGATAVTEKTELQLRFLTERKRNIF